VKPNAISTVDCPATSVASIQQFNFLFNTNSGPAECATPSCDVYAVFYMDHVTADGANMAQVHARLVARPTDTGAEIILGSIAEFGTVKKGATMTFQMTWDEADNKVTFTNTIKKATTSFDVVYGALANNNVAARLNTIETDAFVCGPGGVADMSSSWDNIYVTP
jgi:hypothetical protein